MTPSQKLATLQRKKHELRQTFSRLDGGLASGKITLTEYSYYINKVFSGKQEHEILRNLEMQEEQLRSSITFKKEPQKYLVPVLAVIAILGLLSIFMIPNEHVGLTGFVALEPVAQTAMNISGVFTENTTIALHLNSTSILQVSGVVHNGSAIINLVADDKRYRVYSVTEPKYQLSSTYSSYALQDTIVFTLEPSMQHTTWITLPNGNRAVLGDDVYSTNIPGTYSVDSIVNDSNIVTLVTMEFEVRNDSNSSKNTVSKKSISFESVCDETCDLDIQNKTLFLEIKLSHGAVLTLDEVVASVARNNDAPRQIKTLESVELGIGQSKVIDLSTYFVDPNGDEMYFDYMSTPGVDISVDGNMLHITAISSGEQTSLVYASDLYELVQSNRFSIIVNANKTSINSVTTQETSLNSTTTQNTTITTTPQENTSTVIVTQNTTLDCSDADPNNRPLGCVQAVEQITTPQPIYLEDLDRRISARITPIGNILLTGRVIENAVGEPGARDFRVANRGTLGRAIVVAWISEGDLYLRGQLYEEELNINPPSGAYSIQNSQSVTVAYFDKVSGDLHIRGNVIDKRDELT